MKRTCGTILAFVTFLSSGTVGAQTLFTFPLERQGTGPFLMDPTVAAPWTSTSAYITDPEFDSDSETDPQSTDVDEILAYGASAANLSAFGGVGSTQTTGEASCLTAIDATDTVAQVDTIVTALASRSGFPEYSDSYWENAAMVDTRFEVLANTNHSSITVGTLEGSLWLFANESHDDPNQLYASLNEGAALEVIIGGSSIRYTYLASAPGEWDVQGSLEQSTFDDPTAEPLPIDDQVLLPGFDDLLECTEATAVGNFHRLAARIFNPVSGSTPEDFVIGGASFSGAPSHPSDFEWELKASGWFTVRGIDP
jgi:hypothetical protein